MKKIWIGFFIIAVLAVVIVVIITQGRKEPKEIQIGWIGPLTGDIAYYGEMIKMASELAIEEINNSGGIDGRSLISIYEDDGLDPKSGVSAFQKLINVDKVPIVIQAAGSSVMLAEAPIAEKNKVVLISPTCSNPAIKHAGDYIFRTWPSDAYQGEVLAGFAFNRLQKRRAAVLIINNDYGRGVKDEFVANFKNLGGEIAAEENFDPGATDFRTQLAKIKNEDPDLLILSSHYKEGALIMKQIKEMGMQFKVVASDGCFAPEFINLSGDAAEGTIVTNMHWDPKSDDPIVRNFVSKFKAKFNKEAEVYAAAGYDCLKVVALAIEKGGYRSEGIKNALYQIRDFSGVTGVISFDIYGEVKKEYDMFVVKNREFFPFK